MRSAILSIAAITALAQSALAQSPASSSAAAASTMPEPVTIYLGEYNNGNPSMSGSAVVWYEGGINGGCQLSAEPFHTSDPCAVDNGSIVVGSLGTVQVQNCGDSNLSVNTPSGLLYCQYVGLVQSGDCSDLSYSYTCSSNVSPGSA